MILQLIVAFLATVAFSILFNVPKEQYVCCGLTGAVGWFFYLIITAHQGSVATASLGATIMLTALSRYFAVTRRTPITIFLISGIFPLVPGAGIYYTAYHLIMNENELATYKGMETAKVAIAIVLGIVLVLSLPNGLFSGIRLKKRQKG